MPPDIPSTPRFRNWSDYVGVGAIHGAAAWSAYAVVEFLFSSVLFRTTRPYSIFTTWHWKLTGELLLAYLILGAGSGALTGLLLWLAKGWGTVQTQPSRALELGAAATLALAFEIHELSTQGNLYGGRWLQLAALMFLVGLILSLHSVQWMKRLGLLTNYWVVSGLLLGLGEYFSLREMDAAAQLGASIGASVLLMQIAIPVVVAIALWLGRGGRFGADRRLTAASIALCAGLAVVSFALSFGGPASVEAGSPTLAQTSRPNVVLIVMDTVRADHVSALGYNRPTTPHLKELAADSVVYAHTSSASDITLTSHASLFTGMYPSWHGAYCQPPEAIYGRELSRNFPTLAELMQVNGYQTVGVAANLYLRSDFGLERGFDEFRIPRPVPMLPDGAPFLMRRTVRRGLSFAVNTAQFDRLYSLAEDIDSTMFTTLQHRSKPSAPLFLFLNYMDAHFPYVPPAPYDDKFPGKRARMTQDILESEQTAIVSNVEPPAGYAPHCESQYDGGIAYEDAQIGKVIAWLKREKAYDNTMIIVASDHGESFGERKRVGHANSPYQNLLHVPLLVKYPHNTLHGVVDRPVSLIDVAPSILAAVQARIPQTMQGRNLAGAAEPRAIYGETFPCPVIQPPDCPGGCSAKVIYQWPLKYITLSNGKRGLFDLSVDPDEQHTLLIKDQEHADQLDAALAAWRKNLPAQTRQDKKVDAEKLKQLKGLGYIQ